MKVKKTISRKLELLIKDITRNREDGILEAGYINVINVLRIFNKTNLEGKFSNQSSKLVKEKWA